ncbi:beta-lactamase/transpeptidase-like protein [Microdochium trichocladiopsis]|uniref:Beta-lactamase/transpeptidase-like protein n=1 Tax=Microdochium trichocladiopsis TaxID=1682393 RepID=A0A9P8XSF3_9PEZI|nr:beta-lactamase/transpeptidase-like protein [Microdochium trichocladiopsis]KAH7016018.1 beta-lactamase/transpeptidase-like protein [Microdochium trichocladiopsis]
MDIKRPPRWSIPHQTVVPGYRLRPCNLRHKHEITIGSSLGFGLSVAVATCPPTGPVLPPPRLCTPGNLTASLQQSLKQLSTLPYPSSTCPPRHSLSKSPLPSIPSSSITTLHPLRDPRAWKKVDGNTVYRIASISKLITAYVLLLQDGINLDDPITDFVPELSAPGLETYRDITLRMLMTQIGGAARDTLDVALRIPPGAAEMLGLPPAEFHPGYPTCNLIPDNRCTRDDLLDTIRTAGNPWKTGQRAAYSNLGFPLLGYALENISGLPYGEVIGKYIREPLGLATTSLELTALEDAIVPVGMGAEWITMPVGIYNATAGLYSTPKEVAEITRSILSHTLLSEARVNAWLKPAVFTSSTHSARPTEIYTKEGGVPGFGSYVALVPEYGIGITINAAGDDPGSGPEGG